MTKKEVVVIESHDNLDVLETNDIVIIGEKEYRVDNIQKIPVKKQQMFMAVGFSATYYITLRR